jgi:hypothetical protein
MTYAYRDISSLTYDDTRVFSFTAKCWGATAGAQVGWYDTSHGCNPVVIYINGSNHHIDAMNGLVWKNIATYAESDVLQFRVKLDFIQFRHRITVANVTRPAASVDSGWLAMGDGWHGTTGFFHEFFVVGRDFAMVDDIKFTNDQSVGVLEGTIDLQDLPTGSPPVLVEIDVMQGSTVIKRGTALISDVNNSYRIENVPSGTYSVSYRAGSWLTKTVTNVVIPEQTYMSDAERLLLNQARALTSVPDSLITTQFVMTTDQTLLFQRRSAIADMIEQLQ